MALEGDEVTKDWEGIMPASYCTVPGRKDEVCGPDQEWDGCRDCTDKHRCCDLDEDGSMLLSEVTLLPDGTVRWVDKGRF